MGLDSLGLSLGVMDKGSNGHGYLEIYERYLTPFRGRESKLLEIGVGNGACLRMWAEFLGPQADIYGLDVLDLRAMDLGQRITILRGDQADPTILADIVGSGPFDIVIDDGSHQGWDQVAAFEGLFSAVAPGGIYVIEDLHTSYWGWDGDPPRPLRQRLYDLQDSLHVHGRLSFAAHVDVSQCDRYAQRLLAIHYWRSLAFLLFR